MATLRVTNLRGRTGNQSPTLPDGVVVTGIATATSFSGPLTGTATTATNLANAANITTGTIADARLGTVSSSKLSGALPALDGSALINLNIPAGFNELDAALFN
tara:strand:+ start:264 stop:575 length:312 start_codon:yes stop_codon:yes gene_type:complete